MQITKKLNDDITLYISWAGGPYIDLRAYGWSRHAAEVINVWDYAKDESTIPFTREALQAEVNRWVATYGEHGKADLIHDIEENWYR
jgi:hypothetical protein